MFVTTLLDLYGHNRSVRKEEFRYVSLLIDDDRSGSEFHEPTCFNYMYTILFYYIFL